MCALGIRETVRGIVKTEDKHAGIEFPAGAVPMTERDDEAVVETREGILRAESREVQHEMPGSQRVG